MWPFLVLLLFHSWLSLPAQSEYVLVEHLEISDNYKQHGVSGIFLQAKVQLHEIPEAMDTTQWYIFVEMRNSNNQLVYSPQQMPEVYKTLVPKGEYMHLPIIENHSIGYDFFIPYRRVMDDPGLNNYTFNLVVCDRYKRIITSPIATRSLSIQIPQNYAIKVDLVKAEAAHREYDEAGMKIPFLGLFLSGKSKTGKGWPDLVWYIQVGKEYVFESEEATNEFSAKKGTASFRISDTDPVKLVVVDNDDFSADERIGEFIIKHSSGQYTQSYSGLSFDNIIHADFSVSKVLIPVVKDIHLGVSEAFYQGVSGIFLDVSQTAQTEQQLSIRPVFTNTTFTLVQVPQFIKFVAGSLIPVASGLIGISPEQGKNVRLFIPHYAVSPSMFAAVQYYLEESGLLLKQVKSDLKHTRKPVSDIKIRMVSRESAAIKGIHGIKLVLGIDVPEMYFDDLSPFDISYSFRFADNHGNDLTSWLDLLTSIRRFEFSKFELTRPQKEVVFFIPYYKMQQRSSRIQVTAQLIAKLREPVVVLGEQSQSFTYEVPSLVKVPNLRIEVRYRNRNIEKYYFRFFHGKNRLANSDTIPTGKANFSILSQEWDLYQHDEVSFEMVGIDYFGLEQVVGKWESSAELFLSKKPVRLPGTGKGIKNAKIRFE